MNPNVYIKEYSHIVHSDKRKQIACVSCLNAAAEVIHLLLLSLAKKKKYDNSVHHVTSPCVKSKKVNPSRFSLPQVMPILKTTEGITYFVSDKSPDPASFTQTRI